MKFYKVKLRITDLDRFVKFCLLYQIAIIVTYTVEEFWGTTLYSYISDYETPGISVEEKERLISESGFNITNTQNIDL